MPFEVSIAEHNDHSIITLQDKDGGSKAEIFSFGALLNHFSAVHDSGFINVIDGFDNVEDALENVTPFFKSAKLSPYVCRVENGRYKFNGNDYQLGKYISNGNALHGLIYDASFKAVSQDANENYSCVVLETIYDNDLEGYPFRYKCAVEYRLSPGNALTVSTTITNMDKEPMPITDGWHPYFTLGDTIDDYQVEFHSKEMLEFDDALIPTGKLLPYDTFATSKTFGATFFDNCFTTNFAEDQPTCIIRNPSKNIQVEFHPDTSYPYLQFYTPDSRKSIAVENLSAAPDAFNNKMGLKILNPGEEASFIVKYVIRSL